MDARSAYQKLTANVGRVIVGKQETIRFVAAALVAGGHVLLEDVPGTGKTALARSFARSVDGTFRRIQFTPDLLPSDVTGLNVYQADEGKFVFHPGPVFANILLADEINRATPRTQSGLLECMEERQVTIDGETRRLPAPFLVIATQNPVETAGTFPLPEAQLDRFLVKLSMGFPSEQEEIAILRRFEHALNPVETTLSPVLTGEEILALREQALAVTLHDDLAAYIAALIRATRTRGDVRSGVSPRGSLALLRLVQVLAMFDGRDHIIPEDIKEAAVPVLAHRLILPHGAAGDDAAAKIIRDILDSVPVPTESF